MYYEFLVYKNITDLFVIVPGKLLFVHADIPSMLIKIDLNAGTKKFPWWVAIYLDSRLGSSMLLEWKD